MMTALTGRSGTIVLHLERALRKAIAFPKQSLAQLALILGDRTSGHLLIE